MFPKAKGFYQKAGRHGNFEKIECEDDVRKGVDLKNIVVDY